MARHIILPGTGAELLRRELALAFSKAGCRVTEVRPEALHNPVGPERLSELLDGRDTLLFSVNFQGLTPLKPLLEQLRQAGGGIAVWCVDNPWNLLAGMRDPRWKLLDIFVTDASFIEPLKRHGAERVWHLPLAACPELFMPEAAQESVGRIPQNLAPFVFVGRSAFPGKEAFFSGQEVREELQKEALALLLRGARPDLLWWERSLGCETESFWPGKKARRPALGAENANQSWRAGCLAAIAATCAGGGATIDIFGDSAWQAMLPAGARLHPPVDYYTRLAGIYAKARYSLCLTSLQLPEGLNQRHFDVWMAGGVCLSDATPGLSLFPEELVRPIRFRRAEDIHAVANKLECLDRKRLIVDWRAHLQEKHCYAHRVETILRHTAQNNSARSI